jgi:small-conductance mechanosensitive channel
LASQSFLSDLIAFVSIISDKPFEIGDYISVNNTEGTVKKIGIKSVRIESNLGEEVIIPNSKITGSELHNYRLLNKRRFDIKINISLDIPNEKLQLIPSIAENICKENKLLEFIRCSLTNIGDSSFEFVFIAYVLDKNGLTLFKEKEQFIYKLRLELEQNGIYFSLPTMEIKK